MNKFYFILCLGFFIFCVVAYFVLIKRYKNIKSILKNDKKKQKKKLKWDNNLTKEVEFYKNDRPIDIV
jgi:hypothetical protein